jgi:hypothetical protein
VRVRGRKRGKLRLRVRGMWRRREREARLAISGSTREIVKASEGRRHARERERDGDAMGDEY